MRAGANHIDERVIDLYALQRKVQLRRLAFVVLVPLAGDLTPIASGGALAAGYLPDPGAESLS